jgi:hypothetical protein
MASLDNFHTGNDVGGVGGPMRRRMQYPDELTRMNAVGRGLHSHREWDLPGQVPTVMLQPLDPGLRRTDRPTPQYTERRDARTRDLYVPTHPYIQRRIGDTVDGVLLYDQKPCRKCPFLKLLSRARDLVPLKASLNRYQPY